MPETNLKSHPVYLHEESNTDLALLLKNTNRWLAENKDCVHIIEMNVRKNDTFGFWKANLYYYVVEEG